MDSAIILFGLGVGALVGVPLVLAVLCYLVLRRRAPLEIGIS